MKKGFSWLSRTRLVALVGLALTASLVLGGCGGSDSYDTPTTAPRLTATPNALLEPETLKAWFDMGLVNAPEAGSEKVVILTVNSQANYLLNHIPGAQVWDQAGTVGEPPLSQTRTEALAAIGSMVPDGAAMDSLFRSRGIDGNTTIVLTNYTGQNVMNPSRAYFVLRYWGFPKGQIKVLNGGDSAWAAANSANSWGLPLTAAVPVIQPTTFSVRDNGVFCPELRLSYSEMLQEVDRNLSNPATVKYILDARGGTDYTSTTVGAGYSFQGYMANAINDSHTNYYLGTGFKPLGAEDGTTPGSLYEYLKVTLGVDNDRPFITYCVSGFRASVPYFVLDGILGWDVALYDGSWQQWAKYGDRTDVAPPNGAWRTDNARSVINSALPVSNSNLVIDPLNNLFFLSTGDPRANQIEEADALYMLPVITTPTGGSSGGGSSSGC